MVDLMVQKYEISGAVEVMESILLKISRNDLVEKLGLLTVDASIWHLDQILNKSWAENLGLMLVTKEIYTQFN